MQNGYLRVLRNMLRLHPGNIKGLMQNGYLRVLRNMLRLHPGNIKGLMQNGYNYGYLRVLRNMLRPHPGNRIENAGTCCAVLKGTQEHAAPSNKQTSRNLR